MSWKKLATGVFEVRDYQRNPEVAKVNIFVKKDKELFLLMEGLGTEKKKFPPEFCGSHFSSSMKPHLNKLFGKEVKTRIRNMNGDIVEIPSSVKRNETKFNKNYSDLEGYGYGWIIVKVMNYNPEEEK